MSEPERSAARQTRLTGVAIRAMRGSDVQAVATIEAGAFSDPWPAEAFDSLIGRSHSRLQVAVDHTGEILGYCVVIRALDEGEVANIATSPAARGRGVGGALLDEALAHGDATGLASMFLEVRVSNAPARSLYESRGFRPVGRRRGYYQRPDEDALVLRRDAHAGRSAGPER